MAITTLYRDILLDFAKDIAKSAKLVVDGNIVEYPIYKTLAEDGVIKHFIYPQEENVQITKAQLFDAQGRELQYREFNVTKGLDGFAIVFVTAIEIKEATK